MIMTLNEAIVRHNFIAKVLLKNGDSTLSKETKVKVMSMRIELGKIRKEFDEDIQEFLKGVKPEGYDELFLKEDKTPEDEAKLSEINSQVDAEYNAFVTLKGQEEVSFNRVFTEDEYFELVDVNSDDDVEINGATISAPDFLEVLYSLFVG